MDVSLDEAAVLLGKSARQVRYLIQQGRLTAKKDGSRWVIRREDLPLPPGAMGARDRAVGRLRAVADEVLPPSQPPIGVGQLRAWQVGSPLLRELVAVAPEHPAALALRSALLAVSRGCHRFHARDKAEAYAEARDAAADSAALLLLDGAPALAAIGARVEADLLPAMSGLLRRVDRGPAR